MSRRRHRGHNAEHVLGELIGLGIVSLFSWWFRSRKEAARQRARAAATTARKVSVEAERELQEAAARARREREARADAVYAAMLERSAAKDTARTERTGENRLIA